MTEPCGCPWCRNYTEAQRTLCGCCGGPLGYVGDVREINLCAKCEEEA